jgi:hypothetical protein
VQHKRSLCGDAGGHSHTSGRANLFPAEIEEVHCPRPLGGEGGLQPAFSPAGAGRAYARRRDTGELERAWASARRRVRGSKTLGPTEMLSTLRAFQFSLAFAALSNDFHFGKDPLTPAPLPQGGEGRGNLHLYPLPPREDDGRGNLNLHPTPCNGEDGRGNLNLLPSPPKGVCVTTQAENEESMTYRRSHPCKQLILGSSY